MARDHSGYVPDDLHGPMGGGEYGPSHGMCFFNRIIPFLPRDSEVHEPEILYVPVAHTLGCSWQWWPDRYLSEEDEEGIKLHIFSVVMEAYAGAHFMAMRITDLGHEARLISPQFVCPFVKSNKNDFIDAEAICEAASRPSMRFVQSRTETQQAMRALRRVRESLVRDKVKATNQMQAFLLEFGISMPKGIAVIKQLATVLAEHEFPPYRVQVLQRLQAHYHYLVE